jgi:tetratricopeptide (TPR) repeat protein
MKKTISYLIGFLLPLLVLGQTTATEWYEKGLQLKNEKKSSEALLAFQKAVKLKPDYAEALYESGWCQNDLKDYTTALNSLRQARNYWSAIPKVYFEIAFAFEKTGNVDSALDNYNRCLQLKPDYSLVYKQLGYLAYNKDDYSSALLNFQKYEEFSKGPITDYLYWYRKGFACNALKQYEPAKTALNKSLEFKSDYIQTYLESGFACTKLKQDEEAIGWFKKAIDLDPKNHVPYNGIGEVYRDNKKDMTEAMNWYQKTLAINPNERKANFGMGYCLNSIKKYADAVPYLEKAIQSEPTYTAAYVELGYNQYKLGNQFTAIDKLNNALSLNPKNENARYYLCLIYMEQKNKTMAQKIVDELKALNSRYAAELQEKVNKM